MKFKLLPMLICSLALPAFSQTAVPTVPAIPTKVAVSGADKDKIELALTKMENAQLKGQALQDEAKMELATLGQEFADAKAAYAAALATARTDLKVPEGATFDQKTFTFTIAPVVKPVTEKTATPTK